MIRYMYLPYFTESIGDFQDRRAEAGKCRISCRAICASFALDRVFEINHSLLARLDEEILVPVRTITKPCGPPAHCKLSSDGVLEFCQDSLAVITTREPVQISA